MTDPRKLKAHLVHALVGLLLATPGAQASDADGEVHGYLRAGAGSGDNKGPQNCFGLGGNTMKFRLGNECDTYGEIGYRREIAKSDNGVSFVGTAWVEAYAPSSDIGNAPITFSKVFVEVKNLDFLNGGVVWIGKRQYMRPDIHMMDFQYLNLNGTGGGIDIVQVGPGKVSYAVFKDNDTNIRDANGLIVDSNAALRQNLAYEGLPVNDNGVLDMVGSYLHAQGQGANRQDGWHLSVFHRQAKVFGGTNTFGVQYGVGAGTGIGGPCCGRMGTAGSTLLGSDVTRVRVFNDVVIQPTPNASLEFIALWQRDASNANGVSTWTTVGVRPVWALTQNVKLQAEIGHSRVSSSQGAAPLELTTLTLAPTLSLGPSFWSRPELRAFVSYGKWNDAARSAVNASNNAGPAFGTATSGVSVGLQVETWF